MKFNKTVERILEDFNVFPAAQTAVSAGPDIGMTTGDPVNTFPSNLTSVSVNLPKKKKKKKRVVKPL